MPNQPIITAAHEKLWAFVGDWRAEEILAQSRWMKAGRAAGFVSARTEFGGFYVDQTYRQEQDGAVVFQGRGVFGFDTGDQHYKLYWFDTLGFVPPAPASGVWRGDTLTLVRASFRGAARHTYTFHSPDAYTIRIDYAWEGETWEEVLTATYRRV
jgi:hypothetical protein